MSGDANFGTSETLLVATEGSSYIAAVLGFDAADVALPPSAGPLQSGQYQLAIEACSGVAGNASLELVLYVISQSWVEATLTASCGDEALPGDNSVDCLNASAWDLAPETLALASTPSVRVSAEAACLAGEAVFNVHWSLASTALDRLSVVVHLDGATADGSVEFSSRVGADAPTLTLDVDAPALETWCNDGWDDDQNGQIDCDDEACILAGYCPEVLCEDEDDNDLDGLVDCCDPHCYWDAACANRESNCADAYDNDGDGRPDCSDTDCLECADVGVCTDGEGLPGERCATVADCAPLALGAICATATYFAYPGFCAPVCDTAAAGLSGRHNLPSERIHRLGKRALPDRLQRRSGLWSRRSMRADSSDLGAGLPPCLHIRRRMRRPLLQSIWSVRVRARGLCRAGRRRLRRPLQLPRRRLPRGRHLPGRN